MVDAALQAAFAPAAAGAPPAMDVSAAAAAAAPPANPAAASSAAAAAAAPGAGAPAKGLLLRVKRKRHEAPLDTLVVTSVRAEKRAVLDDLRDAFHKGAQLQDSGTEQQKPGSQAQAADSAGATVPAVPASAAGGIDAASAAPGASAAPAASPAAGTGASGPLFRHSARVFKLLTTISSPKELHANDDKIQVCTHAATAFLRIRAAFHAVVRSC